MCGIIHIKRVDGKSPVKTVLKRYRAQKSRGSQGFGYIAMKDGNVKEYRRAEGEKEIITALEAVKDIDEVIFHHRYPTSTPNFESSAHPIKVSHESLRHDYYIVHNGVIYNDDELKTKHEKLGFTYTTELVNEWKSHGNTISYARKWNDSEALAIELALDFEKGGNGVDVTGSIAFIALQVEKGGSKALRYYFARNSESPLKMDVVKNHYVALTSEGHGRTIEVNKLISFDYLTKEVKDMPYSVGKTYTQSYSRAIGFTYESDYEPLEDGAPKGVAPNENDYIELTNEYAEVSKRLAKLDAEGVDDDESDGLQARLIEIESELTQYEVKAQAEALIY